MKRSEQRGPVEITNAKIQVNQDHKRDEHHSAVSAKSPDTAILGNETVQHQTVEGVAM